MNHNALKVALYFSKNISSVIGIVLIWRGIWYILDYFDILLFGGSHLPLAIAGIIIGLLILYLPDKDLKEIGKL
jgi:hypothetical protein